MPVNRLHAFAEGLTFAAPERLGHLPPQDPQHSLADRVWGNFRQNGTISDEALLGVDAWVVNLLDDKSRFTVGAKSVVRGLVRIERSGHVNIGNNCYIGDDVIISAHAGINIESNVLIAHGVQIFDNISHPLDANERARHYQAILAGERHAPDIPAAPVIIENDAWVGLNSIIMKGVRIGARSIVAAGSVVIDNVPMDTTVAGNPAHTIRGAQ